jgi:hypothetical protein
LANRIFIPTDCEIYPLDWYNKFTIKSHYGIVLQQSEKNIWKKNHLKHSLKNTTLTA